MTIIWLKAFYQSGEFSWTAWCFPDAAKHQLQFGSFFQGVLFRNEKSVK